MRRIPARPVWWLTLALGLALLAMACGPSDTPAPTTPAPGTTVPPGTTATATPTSTATPSSPVKRGGVIFQYNCCDIQLDPHRVGDSEYTTIMYSNLIYNPRGTEIACDLCESWSVENEGKTLVFKLRRGVKFHDGAELTAADVKYTLAKLQGLVDGVGSPAIGLLKNYLDNTKGDATYSQDGTSRDGVTTPDDYTVEVHLKQPSALVPQLLILGAAVMVKEGTPAQELQTTPNGTGPFKLKEVQTSSFMEMERHPNYFGKDDNGEALPYLDGVKFFVIKDESVMLSNFLTERLHMLRSLSPVSRTFLPAIQNLEQDGKILRHRYTSPRTPDGLFFNVTKPPLQRPQGPPGRQPGH